MSGIVPPQAGGPAPNDPQPPAGNPPAPAATPAPSAPPVTAPAPAGPPTQPKYQFNSVEEAVAFAEQMRLEKSQAKRREQQADAERDELRQQVQWLVAQQRLAQQQAIAARVQLLAKNAGFKHPDFVYNAIVGQLQYDQTTGQPTNVQAVLDELKTRIPELLEVQQQPQGQPPAQPGQPAPQPEQPGAPGQPQVAPGQPQMPPVASPTGVMNAPQSAAIPPGGGLSWEVINANIHDAAWVAAHEPQLEAFMANPANHQNRPRR